MIYLASPYSDPDPAVREQRFQAACKAAAWMMRESQMVFSPIAHSHPIAQYGRSLDWAFWKRYDQAHLANCSAVGVLKLDGWRESRGVQAEVALARGMGLPVSFMASAKGGD